MNALATTSARPGAARRRRRRGLTPWLLLSPIVVLISVFMAYPIINVLYTSFFHKNVVMPWNDGFAGLDNYRRMFFDDPTFWPSLGVTGRWVLVQVTCQLVVGLVLALIVNERFRARGPARALVFSPWAISGVLTTSIWLLLYNPSTGIITVLEKFGVSSVGFAPLADVDTAFWAAALAELWRGIPFFAILLLAEVQSIPHELYEAASVDGASRWRRFWHVTLPHLRNVIILSTLLRGVWEFNNVDLLYTLTNGGPGTSTTTLPLYVAQVATISSDFGYGSALTTVAFVILLVLSILYLRLSRLGKD
ncbi:carbohydrate ABC transporter permease [Jiangella endophytica]|uniref:carbohydrate ABC transporter permease n=1 Tax=Jiangella endophytica TaxID=1623398 RepID=UPI001E5CE5BC|nr:sugar ABC transporter permease [Jiangella endophytica]